MPLINYHYNFIIEKFLNFMNIPLNQKKNLKIYMLEMCVKTCGEKC
jgi:hypothetical protein